MLSRTAHRLDLPRRLLEAVGLKRRRRGASDAETLWSLIASLDSARTGDFYFGTDNLDLHRPPCRNFRANQAFYACGQTARLLLRAVQYELLPIAARTHGLRTLIRHLIRAAARLVRSGRRWRLDFAKTNFRLDCAVRRLATRIAPLSPAARPRRRQWRDAPRPRVANPA